MMDLNLILSQISDPELARFLDLATSQEARWDALQRLIKRDKGWKKRIDHLLLVKHDGRHSDADLLDELIDSLDLKFGMLKVNSRFARQFIPAETIQKYETVFGQMLTLYSDRKALEPKRKRAAQKVKPKKKVKGKKG